MELFHYGYFKISRDVIVYAGTMQYGVVERMRQMPEKLFKMTHIILSPFFVIATALTWIVHITCIW